MEHLPTLAELVPQIMIALVIVGAVAWFRKQDSATLANVRTEIMRVRMSQMPDDAERSDPGDTGRHRAAVDHWARLDEKLEGLDATLDGVALKVDEEIQESRRFREQVGQRVTALETDVKWLSVGKRGVDTHSGGKR